MKNQFRIQIKETKEVIRYFDTLEEAKHEKLGYPSFLFEIAELTLDGTYKPVES
jgi:hypothetical protein